MPCVARAIKTKYKQIPLDEGSRGTPPRVHNGIASKTIKNPYGLRKLRPPLGKNAEKRKNEKLEKQHI